MKYEPSLLKESADIYLKLEQYSDIFSDFDIRPYEERALSIDFLEEVKRAASDKEEGGIELMLHIPESKRNESEEEIIRERLVAHFKRHYSLLYKEKRRVMKLGSSMVFLGIICMIVATLIIFKDTADDLFLSFLVVFLEPAAWFLLWEGMDQIIFNSKNMNADLNFYRQMFDSRGQIHFKSY